MLPPQPGQQPPPLTRQDWKKIQKSMKKPEFLGLLSQYMVEISDPKNKKEYDDYLRQMETDGQLPKHMRLIQPKPEFCVKTGLVSERNKSQEMKFFINMCSAEEIEKPSFEIKAAGNNQLGQSWKIPNSMGKIRYDQDVHGAICNTVDAVFHPETFNFARNKAFEAMIINIAIETAQRQLGERKETLSKDYIVMEKLKCKGGQPAILPIREIEGKVYSKGEGGEQQRDRDGAETKLQKQIMDRKKEHQQQKEKQQLEKKKEEITEDDLTETPLSIEAESKGPQRPQYSTIYTYPVQYMDFIEGGVTKSNKHPSALNIEFKIPLVQEFKEIKSLDINEDKILLDAGDKYFIDLSLSELKIKYKLLHSDSKAKFDKKKRSLRITIPIDVASIPPQPVEQPAVESVQQPVEQPPVQNEQIVDDKTWQDTTKILEICQPKVSLQILNKPQSQQKQVIKFVQQIDQDDITSHEVPKPKEPQSLPKQEQRKSEGETTLQLGFKFQEVRQKSFIIINLPKYKKEDLEVIVSHNKILLLWNNPNGNKYLNAMISKQVGEKDVQIVYVVDFVVINIAKQSDNHSISIETVQIPYRQFLDSFNQQKLVVQAEELARKRQAEQKETRLKEAESEKRKEQTEEVVQEMRQAHNTQQPPQLLTHQRPCNSQLTPQFLPFSISLTQELD